MVIKNRIADLHRSWSAKTCPIKSKSHRHSDRSSYEYHPTQGIRLPGRKMISFEPDASRGGLYTCLTLCDFESAQFEAEFGRYRAERRRACSIRAVHRDAFRCDKIYIWRLPVNGDLCKKSRERRRTASWSTRARKSAHTVDGGDQIESFAIIEAHNRT